MKAREGWTQTGRHWYIFVIPVHLKAEYAGAVMPPRWGPDTAPVRYLGAKGAACHMCMEPLEGKPIVSAFFCSQFCAEDAFAQDVGCIRTEPYTVE